MEIELKYSIDKFKADKIFNDEFIHNIMDEDSEENIPMQAVYFDTEDKRLHREGIAFRVRREGSAFIATLKWNGSSDDGMHKREEINIPTTEAKMNEPDVEIFEQSQMYETLKKVIGSRKLIPLITMDFNRHQARVDNGAIFEVSVDEGKVCCNGKEAPILELEIELYSGNADELADFGRELSQKYQLIPENKSKFKRALELME